MRPPLAIGIDDFREIREGKYYYVDKTLMIRDFLEYKNKVAFITRPRRFGKSLNMTMLREFFDITRDSKAIFSGLKIMETEYAKLLNTKPVIYLTFKGCSGATMDDLKDRIAREMVKEYERFAVLFDGKVDVGALTYTAFFQTYKNLKRVFFPRCEARNDKSMIDTGLLQSSLFTLTQAVSTFYNEPPLLLIDEYDQPLIHAHTRGFRNIFSETFYADFLGDALKGNEHLGQNLLTGIQRVAKESIFSKLNNFILYTVSDSMYAPYFGLTEEETKSALESYGLTLNEEVKSYYNGYFFGNTPIYNPWSILNYMNKKKLAPYWINTSTNALIKEAIPKAGKGFQEHFERLILNEEVRVAANLETSFVELATPQTLWGLLVNSGYLTVVKDLNEGGLILRIPNNEIKREFREIVAVYSQLENDQLNLLFSALSAGDMDDFLKIYQDLVYRYVSTYDIRKSGKGDSKHLENSYHMLFLGMAISMNSLYEITSNLEAGDGRADIIMRSLQPDCRPSIVVEFKQGDDVKKLKQKALEQILEKKYYSKLTGNVLCIGIAHNKKQCELVHKEITV